MSYQTIIFERKDDIAQLTFNRPEVSNGFNVLMCEEILDAIETVKQDKSLKILIIKGNGKVFSVGGDLDEMQRAVSEDDISSLVRIAELVQDISFAIKKLPKPVILCANGPVAGAAFNIALAVDFCIATTKTKFIQAFVNVGLAPDAGGLYLLVRSLGLNRATHLVMTGEAVSAEKAENYGFVYKMCTEEELDKVLNQLLKRLKRGSFNSYGAMKSLLWESYFSDWDSYADLELSLQKSLAFREDFKEGVRAYGERRRPKFTGE
ncbi:enoyl-CoA hydratase [Streptococcus sp. CSL10205-OR2]|uniref:trans-2-decenoyl-ACP isomerase n=1 Tax=Streptococcus sp. CSL10205-OR2 TaxID=2980558 RepID=UPI0021D8349F|nr:enoyl-CoA hydratase [Streptococcus sp. CSL10205-OR2]MCU9534237.1 enoyl-CoA hydratase [Streptococcus sp. CSL10205-OR2]